MMRRGIVVIVALACCAIAPAEPEGTKGSVPAGQATDPTPEIFVTGIVLNRALNGNDVNVDLKGLLSEGIPISPDVPFISNHSIALHVRCKKCAKPQDYQVFLSPNDPNDPMDYAIGTVETGSASVRVGQGWLILLGEMPIGETEWGSSTASGTAMAINVYRDSATGRMVQCVYNLEPPGSKKFIEVEVPGQMTPKKVHAGQWIKMPKQPTQIPSVEPIPAAQHARIAKVKKLAKQVGLEVDKVPASP
jgi:hypothetical protein